MKELILTHEEDSFDHTLAGLVEMRRKRDKSYHLNNGVRELLRAKQAYLPTRDMFIWFADVVITEDVDKVSIEAKTQFMAETIQKKFGKMLRDNYDREIEFNV